jgi:hypothetical protein
MEYQREYREKNSNKPKLYSIDLEENKRYLARAAANRAYPTPKQCEIDGCQEIGERHHDDYDKPLEIRWLCPTHHKELHSCLRKNSL